MGKGWSRRCEEEKRAMVNNEDSPAEVGTLARTGSQPAGLGVFSDSPQQSTKNGGNGSGVEAGVRRG